ncbi:tyrosine-type recombinase/integrase [Singulisphaera sp. PoT]|uniref:tyrosine-type recombinase/integrase n=1 Tax=Singulisphaera sp. PoT TaxID=3411797 RepID=UPI003BF51333
MLELLRSRSKKNWSAGRLHALAAVYAFTGLRRNEALRLRVEDVDLVQGVIFVRPNGGRLKTKKSRAPVPCPAALGKILCNWLSRCGSEWVFPCVRKRDRPWMHGKAGCRPGDRLKAAGKEAGVEGFTPQSLRHSLATHLAGWWGLKEKQIQLILRHTTVKTQRHYVHPDVVNLCKSVRDFDYAEGAKDPRSLPKFRMRPGVKIRSRIGSRPLAVRPML